MPDQAIAPILVADEIGRILDSDKPGRERLDHVVSFLKKATRVDVCTLYRKTRREGDLYIVCTDGLAKGSIGSVALRRGEGLTGLVVETGKPLPVRDGPSHPRFRYIPGLQEEAFHSFLGVPVSAQGQTIGALVVQTKEPRDFPREDIALLANVARQIGPAAAAVFEELDRQAENAGKDPLLSEDDRALHGRSLSPGCFLGAPRVIDHEKRLETLRTPASRGEEEEIAAIRQANRKVRADLDEEAKAISGAEGQAILMAHKVLLEDPEMAEEVLGHIRKGNSAAESVRLTAVRWIQRLETLADPIFASRATDFRDIGNRLLHALGIEFAPKANGDGKIAALARALLPGDLLRMGPDTLGAIVMTDQGIYSHTAILARSFGIPSVQVEPSRMDELSRARSLLVDGTEGIVLIDPSPQLAEKYRARAETIVSLPAGGPSDLRQPVRTTDGVAIQIGLNAGLQHEVEVVGVVGADMIGLYRTELAFMSRDAMPSFETQLAHYRGVIEKAGGREVVFRTFDFGGDKIPAALRFEKEENPMMGFRSTRFMLGRPELFQTQLRALLTASADGPMSILLPMIATPEELNLALDEINAIELELDRSSIAFNQRIKIGVMLEVPSVMFQIDELSRAADFFCVGTNDLVQYMMAADRSNPRVAWLYQWHHPAILVALHRLWLHCERNSRPVSVCGEMAGHPWAAMLLAGMGFKSLSIDGRSIPPIKWTLMQCGAERLERLAQAVMRATSSTMVVELLFTELEEIRKENAALAQALEAPLERLRQHALW